MDLDGSYHRFCWIFDLERIWKQIKDEREVYITEVDEVLDFSVVNIVDVISHLVAEEPGIVELVAEDLESQEVGVTPITSSCHVKMEVVKLVHEQCRVVQALLGKWVILEVIASEEGFDVVINCRLTVEHIVINILGKLFNSGRFIGLSAKKVFLEGPKSLSKLLISIGYVELRSQSRLSGFMAFGTYAKTALASKQNTMAINFIFLKLI